MWLKRFVLPAWCYSFYTVVTLGFAAWMFLLDTYDWPTQYRLYRKIEQLQAARCFYKQGINTLKKEQEALKKPRQLEKLARERYWMKRPHEDLYIVRSAQP